MFLYTVTTAVIAVVVCIFMAVSTKKDCDVVYGKLDKAGRITNIVLAVVYACLSPLYLFFGIISTPHYDGILGVLGWMVSLIIASAALFCGLGLGLSVKLRKKGKSKLSFAVQFAGLLGIFLNVGLYLLFAGNLLRPLN